MAERDGLSMSIEESFDRYAGKRAKAIEMLTALAGSRLNWDIEETVSEPDRSGAQPSMMNRTLLRNAVDTVSAVTMLIREGFRLQPGFLLRPIVESLAYVVHIEKCPKDLGRFKAGELKCEVALKTAVSLAPNLFRFWGLLSEHYSHVGIVYQEHRPITEYEETDPALDLNLQLLASTVFLVAVVTEYSMFRIPRNGHWFWKQVDPDRLELCMSEQALAWCKVNLPAHCFPNSINQL